MYLQLSDEEKRKIHDLSKQLLNIPYKFGAEVNLTIEPEKVKQIDCSETIEFIFYKIGYRVPDGSYNQYMASGAVKELEVGDLVFKHKKEVINHVGIIVAATPYIVLEADGWQKKVVFTTFDKFSTPKPTASQYAGARRLVKEKVRTI